jgi:phage N-6-adenine-methyltransferase
MMTQADVSNLGYVGRQPNRKRNSDSWFTPESYLSSVKTVLGEITLDPFSDKHANEIVGATYYFDEDTNGLDQDWDVANPCKVFMNPPYSAGMMKQCCDKFVGAWDKEQFEAGIVLVNNATETKWFHKLLSKASAICFTDHRISFWNVDGKVVSNNTRGQAFFYFGDGADVFNEVFKTHGYCQELTSNYNTGRQI